jgi:hypothetical protein
VEVVSSENLGVGLRPPGCFLCWAMKVFLELEIRSLMKKMTRYCTSLLFKRMSGYSGCSVVMIAIHMMGTDRNTCSELKGFQVERFNRSRHKVTRRVNSQPQRFGEERVRVNVCRKLQGALGGVMNSRAATYMHTWFNTMVRTYGHVR